jgi:hypothetical protein
VPGEYARAIDLMGEVGQTEADVAATLGAMAEVGGSEARAQRLKLAEEAANRAHDAAERGVQLQRQAARWAEHADVVALCQSLDRAGRMLTDLAGAETDLAATLMSVASRGRRMMLRSCGMWRKTHGPTRGARTTGHHPCASWRPR